MHLVKWLLEDQNAEINAQNGKGQTALHMSVAYDFDEQADYLVEKGADKEIANADGHKAWNGIDGDKNLEAGEPTLSAPAEKAAPAAIAPEAKLAVEAHGFHSLKDLQEGCP